MSILWFLGVLFWKNIIFFQIFFSKIQIHWILTYSFYLPLVFSSYLPSNFTKFDIQGQFWMQNYMRIPKLVLLFVFEQILMEKIRFKVTEGEICFATLYSVTDCVDQATANWRKLHSKTRIVTALSAPRQAQISPATIRKAKEWNLSLSLPLPIFACNNISYIHI